VPGRRFHPDELKEMIRQTSHGFCGVFWPRVKATPPPMLNIDFQPKDKYK
jgi:hypothetical protein